LVSSHDCTLCNFHAFYLPIYFLFRRHLFRFYHILFVKTVLIFFFHLSATDRYTMTDMKFRWRDDPLSFPSDFGDGFRLPRYVVSFVTDNRLNVIYYGDGKFKTLIYSIHPSPRTAQTCVRVKSNLVSNVIILRLVPLK